MNVIMLSTSMVIGCDKSFLKVYSYVLCSGDELSFCNLMSITESDYVIQGPSGGKLTVDIKQHPPPPLPHRSPGFPASLWTLECCVIAPLLLPPLKEAIFCF